MDILLALIDFILHVDVHLSQFVADHGAWVYALLFAVGTMCGAGLLDLPLSIALLVSAAVLGDQVNYSVGRYFGPKVFGWPHSRYFNRRAFDRAHEFYERYGGITIILARFLPFIRTFVPFVAGVAEMTRTRFTFYNVVGAAIWVVSLTVAGQLFGNLPWVKENLDKIIWAIIIIPGLLAIFGAWRGGRSVTA